MNNELLAYLGKGEVYALNMGIRYERQRIVKLLEESDSICNDWAIALIKGENK